MKKNKCSNYKISGVKTKVLICRQPQTAHFRTQRKGRKLLAIGKAIPLEVASNSAHHISLVWLIYLLWLSFTYSQDMV